MSAGPAAGGTAGADTDPQARPALIALGLLAVLATVLLLVEGRGITFFFDEWDFLLGRRGHSAEDLFAGQNGNPSFFPVLLFKAVLQVFGADDHWAFRTSLLVLHLVVVGLVLVVASRRVGVAGGAVAAAAVLVLGRASDDLIWAFQTGFVMSVLGGVLALLALDDERDGGRRASLPRDALACAGLVFALFSSSTGIPFLVAAIVETALRPDRTRRAWIVAVPLGLYLVWSAGYGDSQFRWDNVPLTPAFAADLAASTVGGVFGLSLEWGRPLALGALIALVAWWLRGGRATPRLWGLLAGLVVLWALTGFARASVETAGAARYVYAGAVLVVLAGAEVLRGRRLTEPRAAWALVVLVLFAGYAGWGALHGRAEDLRGRSDDVRARLAALDLAAAAAPPGFQPVPVQPQITAGAALIVQRDFGRIAFTVPELREAPQEERAAADETLVRLGELSVLPVRRVACTAPPASTATAPPGSTLTLKADAPTEVRAARFGDAASAPPLTVLPAGTSRLTVRADAGRAVPWTLTFARATAACR